MANIETCVTLNRGNVNDNGNTPLIGQVWVVSNSPETLEKQYCVEITGVEAGFFPYLLSAYTDCYECMAANYALYVFRDCISGKEFLVTVESFGSLANLNEVYYFDYSYCDDFFTSCAELVGVDYFSEAQFNSDVTNCKIGVVQGTPVLQTDCPTCLQTNAVPHLVQRCTDGETDCVLLLADTFIGHLISYSDGIDQYCGVVQVAEACIGPFFNFIQDYGLSIDNGGTAECGPCLSTENQKIKLVNCLDPETTQVVWASAFYGAGDVSNLSLVDGCYEVSGYTIDEDVTINNFFNFEPQPGCDPCVECNGVIYSYMDCSENSYTLRSFQALSAGTHFYDPLRNFCGQILGTSSGYYTGTVYSVETFNDCPDCNATADINYWEANICAASGTSSSYYVNVTTDSTVGIGDVVKLMWGSNEWVCGEITSTSSSYYSGTFYNTKKDSLGETVKYPSCSDCNSQGAIGITLLSCDIPYTESFVQITLENYLQILNYGSLQNYSVSDQNGNCYTISNVCPIPLNSNEFTPVGFYFNCSICNQNTPDPARSAGTEVFICEICCDCGATGSTTNIITPPHPVWTDGYGRAVTQLNMIVLGGPNGLNA